MSEYLKITLQVPESRSMWPGAGRSLLGQAIEESEPDVGDELLTMAHRHRRKDGRVISNNGPSPFHIFCPTRQKMVVIATGDAAAAFLAKNVHHLVMWLSKKTQASAKMDWQGGRMSVRQSNSPVSYTASWLAMKNIPSKAVAGMSREAIETDMAQKNQAGQHDKIDPGLVASVIHRGITSRADCLGLDLDESDLAVEVVSNGVPVTRYWKHKHAYPILDQVQFQTNVRLDGPWFIGACASKGWGRVVRCNLARADAEAA